MRFMCVLATLLLPSCAMEPGREPAGEPPGAAVPSGFAATVDGIAARAVAEVPIDALSIVVLHGGDTVLARGYGTAAGDASTTFRIGSISKTLTALAVLQLADEGRVRLDDRLGAYFPAALPEPDVTIAQLLNHTSGLPTHEMAAVEQWRERRVPITDPFVWDLLRREPRLAAPGAAWSYASSNFHLLGLLVERVTGRDYESQVRAAIAEPLGLDSLTLCSGRPPAPHQAPDYFVESGRLSPDANWTLPGIGGGGGWCASATDVARLVHETAHGRLLEAATLARTTAPTTIDGIDYGYGLGVRLGQLDAHPKWGHTGGGAVGNRTVVAHYPAQDLTIAVLANTEREDSPLTAIDIEALVARAALGLPPATMRDGPLPAGAERYEGLYEIAGRRTRVARDGDRLVASRVGSDVPPEPMHYQGGHAFVPYADSPGYRFVFRVDGAGKARAITTWDAGWFAGTRVRVSERGAAP